MFIQDFGTIFSIHINPTTALILGFSSLMLSAFFRPLGILYFSDYMAQKLCTLGNGTPTADCKAYNHHAHHALVVSLLGMIGAMGLLTILPFFSSFLCIFGWGGDISAALLCVVFFIIRGICSFFAAGESNVARVFVVFYNRPSPFWWTALQDSAVMLGFAVGTSVGFYLKTQQALTSKGWVCSFGALTLLKTSLWWWRYTNYQKTRNTSVTHGVSASLLEDFWPINLWQRFRQACINLRTVSSQQRSSIVYFIPLHAFNFMTFMIVFYGASALSVEGFTHTISDIHTLILMLIDVLCIVMLGFVYKRRTLSFGRAMTSVVLFMLTLCVYVSPYIISLTQHCMVRLCLMGCGAFYALNLSGVMAKAYPQQNTHIVHGISESLGAELFGTPALAYIIMLKYHLKTPWAFGLYVGVFALWCLWSLLKIRQRVEHAERPY